MTSLQYQLVVKTFIKQDALEIIVKDFDQNSGLNTDLLSNFHHNLTVLVQSVWIKANQQHHPMIVFNLTMTSYDTPLLYNNLLKTLNFLLPHDENNMEKKQIFVFADHIHFDKGGTKAVDLIDNVEMYNLKYPTQHNKKNNPYSLEITEMRLCERVKLNMNEYDIYNAKLYLKHAKVSLYGREYFVDRKNQIFVCKHVYNNKQKHTTDVLSKPDDNIDDDQSEKDVMRDFGFFIGCLALLMLFVAVALAKKNYLNKRLRQMAGASGNTGPVNDNSEITASDERPAEKTL